MLVVFYCWFGVRFDLNKKFGLMVGEESWILVVVDVLLMVTVGLMAFILQGCDLY